MRVTKLGLTNVLNVQNAGVSECVRCLRGWDC